MYGHGGERMVMVWVLNDKDKKEPVNFLDDRYKPETNNGVLISLMLLAWTYTFKESYKKTIKQV